MRCRVYTKKFAQKREFYFVNEKLEIDVALPDQTYLCEKN